MKSTILASALLAFPLLTEASVRNDAHHRSLLAFRRHESHKRHAALSPSSKLTMIKKKRSTLQARKPVGNGDVTEEPKNLAKDSYTAKQGCAIWHTVGKDEVCLGLIDKSSKDFDLNKFLEFNPSLNKECSNLRVGQAYCVDTAAGATAAPVKEKTPAKTPEKTKEVAAELPEPKSLQASLPQSDAKGQDDEEDCEEEDEVEDDEDCEEDDEDSQDTVISVKTTSKSQNNAPKEEQAPKEQPKKEEPVYEAPKETYKAPEQTYQAPSPTYEAPKETYSPEPTYEAPKETYSPEPQPSPSPSPEPAPAPEQPKPEEPKPENGGGGGGFQHMAQPATYYYQNGNPGSCGDYSSDSDMIVAIKSNIMGSSLCGKSVRLRNSKTGKEVMATVKDTCPTCTGDTGIDLSEGLFKALVPNGDLGVGMFNVDYSIL